MRSFAIFILFIFVSINAKSQLSLNVQAGLNYSNIDFSLIYDKSYRREIRQYYKYLPLHFFGIGIDYLNKRNLYSTGINYVEYGYKEYFGPPIVGTYQLNLSNVYLELPLLYKRSLFYEKLFFGGGIVLNYRLFEGDSFFGERNTFFGANVRVGTALKLCNYFEIDANYSFCNADKYFLNIREKYLYHVFYIGGKINYKVFKKKR